MDLEEFCKRNDAHLAGCHCEFAVLVFAEARHVPCNRDVVGRVGEYRLGLFTAEQLIVAVFIQSITAQQKMIADVPAVAERVTAGTERSISGTWSASSKASSLSSSMRRSISAVSNPVIVTSKLSSTDSSWSSSVNSARSHPAFSASLLSAITYARIWAGVR